MQHRRHEPSRSVHRGPLSSPVRYRAQLAVDAAWAHTARSPVLAVARTTATNLALDRPELTCRRPQRLVVLAAEIRGRWRQVPAIPTLPRLRVQRARLPGPGAPPVAVALPGAVASSVLGVGSMLPLPNAPDVAGPCWRTPAQSAYRAAVWNGVCLAPDGLQLQRQLRHSSDHRLQDRGQPGGTDGRPRTQGRYALWLGVLQPTLLQRCCFSGAGAHRQK